MKDTKINLTATKVTLKDYSNTSYLLLSGSPDNPIKDYIPKSLISKMNQEGSTYYFSVPLWFAEKMEGLEYHLASP